MKILITGINSSLGLYIAKKLAKEKNEVLGLGLSPNKDFKTFVFDLGLDKELKLPKVDACVHLAFITNPKYCDEKKEKAYKVNVFGTKKVLDYCKNHGVKKFILISTGGVYGFNKKILKEDMKVNPHNSYAAMKHKAEILAKKYSRHFDVIILRYFFPYGPGTKKSSLINRLVLNIMKNKKIYLNKGGKPDINPIYISDVANATCKFLNKKLQGARVFNIAGNEKTSIKRLCLEIASLLNKNPKLQETDKVVNDMVASIAKLSEIYKPKISLREGLKRTVEYIKKHELKK